MKILLVNKYYYLRGGSEKYFFELENLLRKKGHQVCIFSMTDKRNQASIDQKFFIKNVNFKNLKELKNIFYRRESVAKIKQLVDKYQPDLVHLNNINFQLTTSIISYLDKQNIPLVMTLHDYQLICPNHLLYTQGHYCQKCLSGNFYHSFLNKCWNNSLTYSLATALESYYNHWKKIYQKINLFISPSQFLKDKMVEAGFAETKIKVLSNFLNLEKYNLIKLIKKENYYLYLGRLTEDKGLKELINFFINQPNYKLKIAGQGKLENYIKKFPRNNIEYLGYLSTDQTKGLITRAKALIIPSKWPENCPYSVLESLALGTPVIARNFAGLRELVAEDQNGYLFNDFKEVLTIFKKIETNNNLVNQTREFSKKYNDENYYSQLIDLYQKIIDKDRKNC